MSNQLKSIVYKNELSLRDTERLYLDAGTADVYFLFHTSDQKCEFIPAHKSVLSIKSPVFDSMFYASNVKRDYIDIDDVTCDEFKEFLQFFYLSAVELTVDNFRPVMNLVRKYDIEECVDACSEVCELTLTADNMCWGYKLAILFKNDELERFCEEFICKHPYEIFRSSSFLNCESCILRCILQFDSMQCDESVIFDGCMAWARANCIRNGIDETNMSNIRKLLSDVFYEIRFGDMAIQDFYHRYCLYKDLFSLDEFEDIISMIALKNHQSPKFNQISRCTTATIVNNTEGAASERQSTRTIIQRKIKSL